MPTSTSLRRFVPTDQPVLRLLAKRARAARARGDGRSARRYAMAAHRLYPRDQSSQQLLGHVLSAAPVSRSDVQCLQELMERQLASGRIDLSLLRSCSRAVWRRLDNGDDLADLTEMLVLACRAKHSNLVRQFRPEARRRADRGDSRSIALISRMFEISPSRELGDLAHEIAIRTGELTTAQAIVRRMQEFGLATVEDVAHFEADMSIRAGDAHAALMTLLDMRPQRERQYSERLIDAYRRTGGHQAILDYLDGTAHGLEGSAEAVARFEALEALQRFDEASDVAVEAAEHSFEDLQVFRQLRRALGRVSSDADAALEARVRLLEANEQRIGATGGFPPERRAVLASLYFELGRFDDVRRLTRGVEGLETVTVRLCAILAYLERRFDDALALIDALGDERPWDTEKLRARILLEQGDFAGATRARRATPQMDGQLDEVLYHALLCLGEFDEAFRLLSPEHDQWRTRAVFGDRWEDGAALDEVEHRLVLAQAGPGDEIMLASTYRELSERSQSLDITCDPRLESLLARSFPDISFIPVDRQRYRPWRTNAPTSGDNAALLFDLLDDRALARGLAADRVLLAKALGLLKVGSRGSTPSQRYIVPCNSLVGEYQDTWADEAPIGILWRSENMAPQRAIHYVRVEDLRPLLDLDLPFVNLQYDVSLEERELLVGMCGDRIRFLDDLDIRNDFEAAAATVGSLRAMVGVGTTLTELSGAVGTPTVMIQPTHFGTWRAQDNAGTDFWHRSVRVTNLPDPCDRRRLIDQARDRLLDVVDSSSSTPAVP